MPVQTQILTRRGTAASWTSTNPTLGAGEIGYETDTGRFKIGTGSTAWASLAYFNRDPLTTKGDLYTFSTTDDRLAVGNNGESLVADSSTSTGLRYQASYNSNGIINGAFDIAQRGTSMNTASNTFAYTLDRLWVYSNGPAITTSQQVTGDTTNLPNIQYCARLQRQSGQTSTTATVWNMPLETKDSIRFAGQSVTVSAWVRKSATYTAGLSIQLITGTGTDQSGLGGYTGEATPISVSATLTTTWQRVQGTATIAANTTEVRIQLNTGSWSGTAGASDYVEITGIQLELGSIASSFKRAGGTIQGELAACQRYYERATAATSFENFATGFAVSATMLRSTAYFKVTKRAAVTSVDFSTLRNSYSQTAITAVAFDAAGINSATINCTTTGLSTNLFTTLLADNSTNAFLGFSAEL